MICMHMCQSTPPTPNESIVSNLQLHKRAAPRAWGIACARAHVAASTHYSIRGHCKNCVPVLCAARVAQVVQRTTLCTLVQPVPAQPAAPVGQKRALKLAALLRTAPAVACTLRTHPCTSV